MNDYPLEDPFFSMINVQASKITGGNACYLAYYSPNDQYKIIIKNGNCNQKQTYICQKRLYENETPKCSDGFPNVFINSTFDFTLDPRFLNYRKQSLNNKRLELTSMMRRLDQTSSYHSFFKNPTKEDSYLKSATPGISFVGDGVKTIFCGQKIIRHLFWKL